MSAVHEAQRTGVAPIVEQIAAAQRRRRRTYRLVFAATWVVLLGAHRPGA